MSVFRMQAVLQVLFHFDRLPRGYCPVGLSAIAFWSGCSRSTVYRYCKALKTEGLVEYVTVPNGHKDVTGWRITEAGVLWMDGK